ncbi:MAG: hypothetical protein ACF787_01260 [Rhodopirellula sp. JB053]
MKRLLVLLCLSAILATQAHATQQINDRLVVNGKTYGIFQLPMNGYWRREDEPADDRKVHPLFDATNSSNWRDYVATFAIANGRLYLNSIEGRINGEDVADREIIEKRFPVRAHWYTGSIFISVGGYDMSSKRFEYVIEFAIERGKLVRTRYTESRRIPMTWNGLAPSQSTGSGTEPSDAPESASRGDSAVEDQPRRPGDR